VYNWYGFDIGLSAKRNRLAREARTELAMFLDDDVMWTNSIDIPRALSILRAGADVVSFGMSDRGPYTGSLRVKEGVLYRCIRDVVPSPLDADCLSTEIAHNQMLGKSKFYQDHPWDERLKLQEHEIWFLSIQNSSKIVSCPKMILKHARHLTREYNAMRDRNFRRLWKDMYGIKYYREKCLA